jgi:glycosyltransferase involved in cell wall biosynthesis
VDVARRPDAARLLFVGDARLPAQGADRLIGAVAQARDRGVAVELEIVSRPGQEPPGTHPEWMHVRRAEGDAIHALLPEVLATVIPRPRGPYNDLSLPIKLFDYLSYGRPLLVTDCTEQARVVREADAGLVVHDDVDTLAGAIAGLASTPPEQLDAWSRNAHAAAREASWGKRATQIRDLLMDR